MKKQVISLFIVSLIMIMVGFVACNNESHNPQEPIDEKSAVYSDSFFWGTWVRMDNGTEYEVLETNIKQEKNSYKVTSSDDSTLTVDGLGTFEKESDSVIVCENIPYFRKGGSNLEYSLKLVGFIQSSVDSSSSQLGRAAGTIVGGIKAKGKSSKYKNFESDDESDDEGIITLTAPTVNDPQTVEIIDGDEIVVIPGLTIVNSGDYMGTVALVGKDDYNLKITGTISDDQKNGGYLYGNNAKTYNMVLTITNISENRCKSSVCSITTDDPKLTLSSTKNLEGFTISTLVGGATMKVELSLLYGELSEPYIDTGIIVTLTNSTGQEWNDYIPLRFFKGTIPITISAKNPENNEQAALNGFVIYPDGNNQFFAIDHNACKPVFVPTFGSGKPYKLVFSGATVTSKLDDSTEMYYTVETGTLSPRTVITEGDRKALLEYMNFGGDNHSENTAYSVTEGFEAYLSEGEIDYYTITADSEEFYGPSDKKFVRVSYVSEYEEVPTSFYIAEGSKITDDRLPLLEHKGMTFVGWYDGNTRVLGGSYSVKDDVTLTAKWELEDYKIEYELGGGTNNPLNPSFFTIKSDTITFAAPERKGYEFKGWYLKEDYSGDTVPTLESGSIGTLKLYAKWEPVVYKIEYVLNGRNAGSDDEAKNNTNNPKFYTIEENVTFASAIRNGYAFSGWYNNESFNGTKVPGISAGTTGDITLYARWLKECFVSFETERGTAPQTVIIGETDKLSSDNLPTLECAGYSFEGWYDGETLVVANNYTATGNVTLKAKWQIEKYTVAYYLNGGKVDGENLSEYTIESEVHPLKSPLRNAYKFEGWFTSNDFSGTAVESIGGGITVNLILYAKWKPCEYTISYNLNGGTNDANNPTKYTIETDSIILAEPQRDDYLFRGWYEDEDFCGTKQIEIKKGSYLNKTFYAKWVKKCTIQFVNAYGNPPDAIVVGEGEPFVESHITRPKEEDLVFLGWFTDSSFDDEKKISNGFIVTNNLMLYAGWSDISNTVVVTKENLGSIDFSVFNQAFFIIYKGEITMSDLQILINKLQSVQQDITLDMYAATGITVLNAYYEQESYFRNCHYLKKIILPECLKTIGEYAFYNCLSLESVTIGNNVTVIGSYAFSGSGGLKIDKEESKRLGVTVMRRSITPIKEVILGNSVSYIGDYAFWECKITSLIVPNRVKKIGIGAFNCTSLMYAYFEDVSTWYYSSNTDFSNRIILSEFEISDSFTAANYLKTVYKDKYFYKE